MFAICLCDWIDMNFDVQTAAFLGGVGLYALALLLLLVGHHGERDHAMALRAWILALLLQAVGLSLLALRSIVGESLAVILGNALLLIAATKMVRAVRRISHLPLARSLWLVTPAVMLAVAWFQLVDRQLAVRIVLVSLTLAGLLVAMIVSVHRSELIGHLRSARALAGVAGLGAVCLIARALYVALDAQAMPSYFSSTPFEILVHSYINFGPLWLTLCFVLILRDRAYDSLGHLAAVDPLTGIANRRSFEQRALSLLALSQRQQLPMALLLIDADHFKRINDRFGHQVGDEALQVVVKALQSRLRPTDVLGRHGGEEFIVALDQADLATATGVADRLREAVTAASFSHDGERVDLRISIGIAMVDPATLPTLATGTAAGTHAYSECLQQLTRRADAALYQAKQQGRDRWSLAD